jgi:hypothetical protein
MGANINPLINSTVSHNSTTHNDNSSQLSLGATLNTSSVKMIDTYYKNCRVTQELNNHFTSWNDYKVWSVTHALSLHIVE